VGNIVTGDDLQTQVVIASGALAALLSLLSSSKDGIRKEACWTISNITAGSPHQIQAVIEAGIIPPLVNILQNADFKTKKEAAWAISNATSGGLQEPQQIRYLVEHGCIKPLCDLLKALDNKIIQVALDGLDNILKVGEADKEQHNGVNLYATYIEEAGGMHTIHNLQHHENLDIYKKCFYIMDKYYTDEDGEETGIGGPTTDETGAFAFQSDVAAPQGGFSFGLTNTDTAEGGQPAPDQNMSWKSLSLLSFLIPTVFCLISMIWFGEVCRPLSFPFMMILFLVSCCRL